MRVPSGRRESQYGQLGFAGLGGKQAINQGRRSGPLFVKTKPDYLAGAGRTSSTSMVIVMSSPTIGFEPPTPKSERLILVVADAPTCALPCPSVVGALEISGRLDGQVMAVAIGPWDAIERDFELRAGICCHAADQTRTTNDFLCTTVHAVHAGGSVSASGRIPSC